MWKKSLFYTDTYFIDILEQQQAYSYLLLWNDAI